VMLIACTQAAAARLPSHVQCCIWRQRSTWPHLLQCVAHTVLHSRH
jgi:hypothetical protein